MTPWVQHLGHSHTRAGPAQIVFLHRKQLEWPHPILDCDLLPWEVLITRQPPVWTGSQTKARFIKTESGNSSCIEGNPAWGMEQALSRVWSKPCLGYGASSVWGTEQGLRGVLSRPYIVSAESTVCSTTPDLLCVLAWSTDTYSAI